MNDYISDMNLTKHTNWGLCLIRVGVVDRSFFYGFDVDSKAEKMMVVWFATLNN